MKLRVATYNIHKGVTTLGSKPRVHALKHALDRLDANIVFLQEVQGRHDQHARRHANRWPAAQHEFLAGDGRHVAYGMNAVYDHGHHGNALLSSFPIGASRNQDVSDHRFEQRGILHCRLDTPAGTVHCYVVHFGLFAGGRRRQAEALVTAVHSSTDADERVIVAGDFNDWGDQLSHTLRHRLGVQEVFEPHSDKLDRHLPEPLRPRSVKPARTFPAIYPCLRLDRIYVRGFRVETAEVLSGTDWAQLSDHAPILAELHPL